MTNTYAAIGTFALALALTATFADSARSATPSMQSSPAPSPTASSPLPPANGPVPTDPPGPVMTDTPPTHSP